MRNIPEDVARGVAILDAKGPKQWWTKVTINDPLFDMDNVLHCVIGSLYKGFYQGMTALGLMDPITAASEMIRFEAIEHGFMPEWETRDIAWTSDRYSRVGSNEKELRAEWIRIITERLNEKEETN